MITVRWHYKGRGRVAVESGEDYGNGRRLIREKVVEYEECDDDYDIEYDVDCDEPPPKKKKEKPDNKRFSMMTGSEFLRKKKGSEKG